MTGQLNHLVALERTADLHRAAERHRRASAGVARSPRVSPQPLSRGWLGLRRALKVA